MLLKILVYNVLSLVEQPATLIEVYYFTLQSSYPFPPSLRSYYDLLRVLEGSGKVKALATRLDNHSLIQRTHIMNVDKQPPQAVLLTSKQALWDMHTHTPTYICRQNQNKELKRPRRTDNCKRKDTSSLWEFSNLLFMCIQGK